MTSRRFVGLLRSPGAVAICCALVAVLAGLAAMVASQNGALHPSALVKISDQEPITGYARAADPGFRFVSGAQHYDGTYYYAIARDPFLRGTAHTLIDQAAYRYGHPLHGWLAAISSLGEARAVPLALLFLSLEGLALGAWAASRLAVRYGRTPWAGLAVAFSPGLLYAATVSTTETVGVALLALTFLAWVSRRYRVAAVLAVMLCLDKEQYVVVPLGLAAWELLQAWRRRSRPDRLPAKVTAVAAGPVVLSGWYVYVHSQLHAWPWSYQPGNFGAPLTGWRDTFRMAYDLAFGSFDQSQIGSTTPPMLIAIAAIVLVAAVVALRARTVFDLPFLGLAVITSMQGWRTLLYSHELLRIPSVVLLFAFAVLFLRRPSPVIVSQREPRERHDASDQSGTTVPAPAYPSERSEPTGLVRLRRG